MMGERTVMQEALFYGFSLERHVPNDHMLRKIDRFVDLSGVRNHLAPYYRHFSIQSLLNPSSLRSVDPVRRRSWTVKGSSGSPSNFARSTTE